MTTSDPFRAFVEQIATHKLPDPDERENEEVSEDEELEARDLWWETIQQARDLLQKHGAKS